MPPYDYHRCKPSEPDSFCQQCARYSEHPMNTWKEIQKPYMFVVSRKNSKDDDCSYIKEKA